MEVMSFQSQGEVLRSCRSALIYGAGRTGRDVVALLRRQGILVRAFLDLAAKPGAIVEGTPVLAPASTEANAAMRQRDTLVVIAVYNRDADVADIARSLEATGCSSVVTFYELYHHFAAELGERFWLAPRGFTDSHATRIRWLRELLADEKSRSILDAIMEQRRTASLSFPRPDPLSEQYMPRDIAALGSPAAYSHFVDCGAFDGDTLKLLCGRFAESAAPSCFEPDNANFAKLAARVRHDLAERPRSVALWPCAVWDKTTQLHFASGEDDGSHISDAGGSMTQTVSLDEALAGLLPPTFIKMDVEGAEIEALLGARDTVRTHRPAVGISVYHRPTHLWQVAERLAGFDLGYQFYLRAYGQQGFDLVLYGIAMKHAGVNAL